MKPSLLALLAFACAWETQTARALEPPELILEVIPIKYARAADLATALLKMTTNGVAATPAAATGSASLPPAIPGRPMVLANALQQTGMPSIVADERTNSLLIHATREDLRRLKEAISQLDVASIQISIEVAIMEVEEGISNVPAIGLAQGKTPGPGNSGFESGSLNRSNALSLTTFVPLADANAAGTEPHGFGYLAKPARDFDSLVSALAGDSRFKILQRPRIQTSDGVAASMFVGQAKPTNDDSSSSATSPSTIQQQLIGVTFEVTPVINPDGCVVMDIHQKIDRLDGTVMIENVGEVPVTSSTEAQAKVVVRNRETVLLGGFGEAPKPNALTGPARAKDLPLPGAPVSGSSASAARKEIIVLVRPTILPKSEAATER
jgi:general secretion pathway protein D